MRAILSGSTYRVELDESDVLEWAERWPCYGERHAIAFEFERRNGDLVDIEGEETGTDESGLAALSNDACRAGAELCGLADIAELRACYGGAESVARLVAAGRAERERERLAAIAAGPMAALRYHTSGAVERGDAEPIIGVEQ